MTLPAEISDWPEDWRERFEERAGIMQFDAGMSRIKAEWCAERDTRKQFDRLFKERFQGNEE